MLNPASIKGRDSIIIGYKGVGQAEVPQSLVEDIMFSNPPARLSPEEILKMSIVHSQYVDYTLSAPPIIEQQ